MTKRELLKQARHVLGPNAKVTVYFYDGYHAQATSDVVSVTTSGKRREVMERLNTLLMHLDVSGWRAERERQERGGKRA